MAVAGYVSTRANRYAIGRRYQVRLVEGPNRMSSKIRYRHGTSTRMIAVENKIPQPSEMAIGMMY